MRIVGQKAACPMVVAVILVHVLRPKIMNNRMSNHTFGKDKDKQDPNRFNREQYAKLKIANAGHGARVSVESGPGRHSEFRVAHTELGSTWF